MFTKENVFTPEEHININTKELREFEMSRLELEKELEAVDKTKASGPDEISCWVLKECAKKLSEPLFIICKDSFQKGKLPESSKQANIVPLFKKGNRQDPLNYRPVSLTSVVCKIMEKIIRRYWVEHLERNKKITKKQFGFRKERSCVTNLLSYYIRISEQCKKETDG